MLEAVESADLVELIDDAGRSVGTCRKLEAHVPPGRLHRAFSVFLFDDAGRILLQRRADAKYHFAGRWSNACCSHPAPGADVSRAASERLKAELGIVTDLEHVASFRYRASDPVSRLVEHEEDTVFVGYIPRQVTVEPDPAEVAAVRFLELDELSAEIERSPAEFTPWLAGALELVRMADHPRR